MEERTGRFGQIKIYTGKLFRMFVYEKGWKIIIFAAVISCILASVVGANMFVIKEDTRVGSFAMVSACIWIGIFNSIQSICKERQIIKREHRTGLHISAYVMAHMVYQAVICLMQTVIMFVIYWLFLTFPKKGIVTGSFYTDLFITFFLMIYAADVLGLAVSAVVHTTTTAMTVMPFILIVQLIFSGAIFYLSGPMDKVSNITISKWGMRAVCTTADINSLPSNTIANELNMFRSIGGASELLDMLPEGILQKISSDMTYEPIYEYKKENVLREWGILLLFILLYYGISVASLELVDYDKR